MARDISKMPGDLKRSIDKLERSLQRSWQATVIKAVKAGVVQHERAIRADSGGDMQLSGVNRAKGRAGNAKVGVKFKLTERGTHQVSAELMATGPLQIINNDTSGHVIRSAWGAGTRGGRGGRSTRGFVGPVIGGQFGGGRSAVLRIPGVGFRRSARHPGTKGKETWQKGRTQAVVSIRHIVGRETDQAARSGFGGVG